MNYREQLIARLRLLNSGQLEEKYADLELDVCVGRDRIVRVNVDGECVLRIRLGPKVKVVIRE